MRIFGMRWGKKKEDEVLEQRKMLCPIIVSIDDGTLKMVCEYLSEHEYVYSIGEEHTLKGWDDKDYRVTVVSAELTGDEHVMLLNDLDFYTVGGAY